MFFFDVLPMLKAMISLLLLAVVAYALFLYLGNYSNYNLFGIINISNPNNPNGTAPTTMPPSTTISNSTAAPNATIESLYNYTLSLINNDRAQFGLLPVTLSNELSGQQHAESMLNNHYFSHWDTYGLKPYMRYTLSGGDRKSVRVGKECRSRWSPYH